MENNLCTMKTTFLEQAIEITKIESQMCHVVKKLSRLKEKSEHPIN
jgi:hypothetical protein